MSDYTSTNVTFGTTSRAFHFRTGTSDETVFKQVLVDRQYDLRQLRRAPELFEFAERSGAAGLRPLVVDAGANIGASALHFVANLPSVHVVAIEPDAENFELLRRNVEGLEVETIHGAVSSATGRARVLDPGQGHWGYRTQPVTENEAAAAADAIACFTVNDIYTSHRPACFPFIVKVDIEGAEMDLFSGNTEWVAATPIVIIELHDWLLPKARTSQPFLQCIATLDRDFVYLGETIFSVANDLDALKTG